MPPAKVAAVTLMAVWFVVILLVLSIRMPWPVARMLPLSTIAPLIVLA